MVVQRWGRRIGVGGIKVNIAVDDCVRDNKERPSNEDEKCQNRENARWASLCYMRAASDAGYYGQYQSVTSVARRA